MANELVSQILQKFPHAAKNAWMIGGSKLWVALLIRFWFIALDRAVRRSRMIPDDVGWYDSYTN